MEAQSRLFASYLSAWQQSIGIPADGEHAVKAKPSDKRFSDPDWNANPIFSSLKQLYLATTQWAEQLVEQAELDERHAIKPASTSSRSTTR
jgi:polyhydroxyalkanoate synthase